MWCPQKGNLGCWVWLVPSPPHTCYRWAESSKVLPAWHVLLLQQQLEPSITMFLFSYSTVFLRNTKVKRKPAIFNSLPQQKLNGMS